VIVTTQKPKARTPGIYTNIPADIYHRWPGASNSRMGDMLRSPAHCRDRMMNPTEPTPAMLIGTATHFAVLEPDLFDTTYVVADRCAASKANGDPCSHDGVARADGVWYCGTHLRSKGIKETDQDIKALVRSDADKCRRIRDAVWSHPASRKMLESIRPDEREVSIVWDDPDSGVRCKLRADAMSRTLGIYFDLKTTGDAGEGAFTKSIFNFGYHRQGAHALHGFAAHGVAIEHFVICAVEKDPPHGVAVYRLDDAAIEAGRDQLLPLIKRFGECERTDTWPAYSDAIQDITLPPWAWRKIDTNL